MGVQIAGDSLATWREDRLVLRSRNRASTSASQSSQAVWLGWNNQLKDKDEGVFGEPARYILTLPETLASAWGLDANTALNFLLAPTEDKPKPRQGPPDSLNANTRQNQPANEGADDGEKTPEDGEEEKEPIDLTIEMVDASGEAGACGFAALRPAPDAIEDPHPASATPREGAFSPSDGNSSPRATRSHSATFSMPTHGYASTPSGTSASSSTVPPLPLWC